MTYTTSEDEYIATLPIGYADGFIRANQGRHVYINGKLYPIVGTCLYGSNDGES